LPELTEKRRRRREETISYDRDNDYSRLHRNPQAQGKVLYIYIRHELMILRFHALLELACRKFAGKVALVQWTQGPELWNRVAAPSVREEDSSPSN